MGRHVRRGSGHDPDTKAPAEGPRSGEVEQDHHTWYCSRPTLSVDEHDEDVMDFGHADVDGSRQQPQRRRRRRRRYEPWGRAKLLRGVENDGSFALIPPPPQPPGATCFCGCWCARSTRIRSGIWTSKTSTGRGIRPHSANMNPRQTEVHLARLIRRVAVQRGVGLQFNLRRWQPPCAVERARTTKQ